MQRIEEEVIKVNKKYCDILGCGDRAPKICNKCHCDLCTNHAIRDPRDHGDYPDCYCKRCFEIGKPFLMEMDKILIKFDNDIKELEEQWRKACMNSYMRYGPA